MVFTTTEKKDGQGLATRGDGTATSMTDPGLVAVSGSVEGGTFRHKAAHFEWLVEVGARFGLGFDELGKRKHGSPATLHFCDKLYEIYGSDDLSTSLGARADTRHPWLRGAAASDSEGGGH